MWGVCACECRELALKLIENLGKKRGSIGGPRRDSRAWFPNLRDFESTCWRTARYLKPPSFGRDQARRLDCFGPAFSFEKLPVHFLSVECLQS
jgi:hypothetical protein